MWETIKNLLLSLNFWSAILYMIIGAIIGAVISVLYSVKAKRPKLFVCGGGAGGNQQQHAWRININNRPSFLGKSLDGESARDVHAHIRPNEKKSQSYMVFWGHNREHRVTIEPGQQQSLELFHWQPGTNGYSIIDSNGEPIARFNDREMKFVLTLYDRLDRKSVFKFVVEYDDTHLKNVPRLQIIHPINFSSRWHRAISGIREFLSAFKTR